jgi:putative colanic acid biosynthesis UDP-glucose lipid carrier transferase
MINRIKFDVFYIENWSLILDLKIISQTVVNIFKGEEKAY